MLNTNLPNVELREKELLLERRHSICLEISKKRRESVASSIFIPKDFLKKIYRPDGGLKTVSRTKKILNLIANKKRHSGRIMAKKKLKRLNIINKKKGHTKVQSCSNSLKHPISYPIIKQIISSEEIRCVVEKLRDQNVTQNSEVTIDNNKFKVHESNLSSGESTMESDQNKIQNYQLRHKGDIGNHEASLGESISTNIQPKEVNDSSKPNERNADSENEYSSVKKVDNFLIMFDSSGSHVEIKYDVQRMPSPNKSVILKNSETENNQYATKYEKSIPKIKTECVESDYIDPKNNCGTSMKTGMINTQTPFIELNNAAKSVSEKSYSSFPEAMKSNLLHSDEDITDQSTKETAGNQASKPLYPIIRNTPTAAYRTENYSLPVQEPRIPSHQDSCCAINYRPPIHPSCCYNYNTTIHPKPTSQPHQSKYNTINKSHPMNFYNSLNQLTSHFDTPPISPNDQQYTPIPSNMRSSIYGLHHQNRKISQNRQIYNEATPSNVMSNELNCSRYTNTIYPFIQHANHSPYNFDDMRQESLHPQNSWFSHPHGQVLQNKHPSKKQYHHTQPTKIDYTYLPHQTSDYNNLDLPKQFYHPLHQSQLSYPNHFEPMTVLPTYTSEKLEAWRLHSNPVTNIPQRSMRSTQSFLPPTTYTSMPSNFPFSSPNWTNTLNNYTSINIKSSFHLNNQEHPYLCHPNIPPDTELTSNLHTNPSTGRSSTALTGSMHNSFLSPTNIDLPICNLNTCTYIHTNQL